jgi:3-phenylpropionate/trans-cinnamate dioxygenase ferredoxin reductase subunit
MADKGGRVVIVGGGHGGGSAAANLRQFGWTGPITLVSDEPLVPYHRPPLSKAWLKGEADSESLALRPESFYAEQDIALRLSTRVDWIDRDRREIALEGGERLDYDHLILATGARPRPLPIPGADFHGVLALRNAADADELKAALGVDRPLLVVGGGYIGLEVAASARALGAAVTVIEREPRLLARVACPELSGFFEHYHRARGVTFELGVGTDEILGEGGRAGGVLLSDGRRLHADTILVGIGGLPNVELAEAAGLACDNGVIVDLNAQTSDPHIYAVGDMTRRPLPLYGRTFRLESVPNALEQAKQAAAHLCDRPAPAPETPWFWSDQYDLKLQIAGLPFDVARTVVRGAVDEAKFAVFHLDADDRVQAVEAVNMADAFLGGRQLIGSRKPVSVEKLKDTATPMKAVAA